MPQLTKSDLWRIPFGLVMAWIGVLAEYKAFASLDGSVLSIIIACFSVLFGIVFLAIGAVMALGWLGAKPKK